MPPAAGPPLLLPLALEIALDDAARLAAALAVEPTRLELCSRLDRDGFTPTVALVEAARQHRGVGLACMVREPGSGFLASPATLEAMLRQIERLRRLGADAIVAGVLRADGTLDGAATAELVRAAAPLPFTFHRAFDRLERPLEALETLLELGVKRVLTSGGASDAWAGRFQLGEWVLRAAGRIEFVAGGGVRVGNARQIAQAARVRELHSSTPFAAVDAGLGQAWRSPAPAQR